MEKMAAEFTELMTGVTSAEDARRRVGAYALAADTASETERRATVSSRLPTPEWPARRVLLVAVDAETGEVRVFDRQSGVSLVDAVAASCAVPGIWPPVTIGDRRYIDGGMRSNDNADLAAGFGNIVVISPVGYDSPIPAPMPLREVVGQLGCGRLAVTVIAPDERHHRHGREPARPCCQDPGRKRRPRTGPGRPLMLDEPGYDPGYALRDRDPPVLRRR